jgi:two-component system response regulator FixJ
MIKTTPTIYLVDDDPAVRDSLTLLIGSHGGCVEAYPDAPTFLAEAASDDIGCLILDIRMPHLSGLALQEQLQKQGIQLPIIFITGHGDVAQCARAFKSGAIDFISKPIDQNQLMGSVRRAIRQSIQLQEKKAETLDVANRLARISERERAVLDMVAEGLSSKEIGKLLDVSPRTIETHRASLFAKLEVSTLAELIRFYLCALETSRLPVTR